MAFVVKYNGSVIHTMAVGEHITLPTNGKIMAGDVEVLDDTPPVKRYIDFNSPLPISISRRGTANRWDGAVEYSTDLNTWTEWASPATTLYSAESGGVHHIYLRGSGNTKMIGTGSGGSWSVTGSNVAIDGDIMNLFDYENPASVSLANSALASMFEGCTSIIKPPSIGYTGPVGKYAFLRMFYGCTNLIKLPSIKSTAFGEYACPNMFNGCTNIKVSETQTAEYQYPFRIPDSGTGSDATGSFTDMFANTGGTFTGTPVINTTYYTDHEPV